MKKFELQHAFQGDDLSILTQTYYRMMDRSDPVMQSYSVEKRIRKRKKEDIPREVSMITIAEYREKDTLIDKFVISPNLSCLTFQGHFLCQKSGESNLIFFIPEIENLFRCGQKQKI